MKLLRASMRPLLVALMIFGMASLAPAQGFAQGFDFKNSGVQSGTPPEMRTTMKEAPSSPKGDTIARDSVPGDWDANIGAAAVWLPEFEGSDDYEILPVPYLDITYRDTIWLKTTRGLGVNLINSDGFKIGPILGFRRGRDSSDASYLTGFEDIEDTLEAGLFVDKTIPLEHGNSTTFSLDVKQDILDGHDGWVAEGEISYFYVASPQWIFIPAIHTSYVSQAFMESFYGVTAAESTASGLPVFEPDQGFKDAGLSLTMVYRISDAWRFSTLLGYKRLLMDAKDSPITDQGSENQYLVGTALIYHF